MPFRHSLRLAPDQWSSMMNDMVSKGLDASDQDLGTIANYLSTYLALSKDTGASAPATPPQP